MDIGKILKEKGYRFTLQREKVFSALSRTHTPLSAEAIYKKAEKDIDLASVYRTLHLFIKIGAILHERKGDRSFFYIAKDHHHHITCEKCGSSRCIPCKEIFKKVSGFSHVKHELVLSGICRKCAHI